MFSARHTYVLVACLPIFLASCQENQPQVKRDDTTVRTVVAEFVDYRRPVKLTGEVAAHITTNLSFRVSGKVIGWDVDVGDHVTAGQVLARIDPKEQAADVDSAAAAVSSAEALLKQATSSWQRQKALLANNSTTQEAFDQAQTALKTAEASLDAANAQLSTARDTLSYAELRADADGIITVRNVETGQVVQTAQTIYTVARDGPRDAVFEVYESLLLEKPVDPKIDLALVSDPAVTAWGTISEVSPTINADTGTVRVKIAMDSTPDRMTLGAPVSGVGTLQPIKLLILPWTALSAIDGKPAVWVVDPGTRTVSLKPVTVTSYETGRVLISDGISAGDIVVIDGTKSLRPGQTVIIAQEQA